MTEQTVSQLASVAPEEATMKRSIQMKMFADKTQHAEMGLAQSKMAAGQFTASVTLGQIIGNIFDVKVKEFETKDGEIQTSLMAVGEFEAVVYKTGEVITSTSAFLPRYYLEVVESIIAKDPSASVVCALEIVLVPTGKAIPVAYEVRNLVRRRPENPLNALKAEMQKAGRLRLPPPTVREASDVIEGEVLAIEEHAPEAAQDAQDAPKGKGKANANPDGPTAA